MLRLIDLSRNVHSLQNHLSLAGMVRHHTRAHCAKHHMLMPPRPSHPKLPSHKLPHALLLLVFFGLERILSQLFSPRCG